MNLDARQDQAAFYDARYGRGYMQDFEDFYEACRVRTVKSTLERLALEPASVLDYGSGEGRYMSVLRAQYPSASITGADISDVALQHLTRRHPWADTAAMDDERTSLPDASFDLIVSVEVLEHVSDVERAVGEIGRLLKPGGRVVLTTPCANPGSLEWVVNKLRGGLQPTPDGFGRFATDEPGHLRRLTSRDLRVLLSRAGLETDRVYFRAQLFTFLMAYRRANRIPTRARVGIGMLDWRLFRRLPNAATMVAVATRPAAPAGLTA